MMFVYCILYKMAEIELTEPVVGQIYVSRGEPLPILYVSSIVGGEVTSNIVFVERDGRFRISQIKSSISPDDFKKKYVLDTSGRIVLGGRIKRRNSTKKNKSKRKRGRKSYRRRR